MKRIFTVALVLLFGLAGVACGGSKQKKADKTAAEQKRTQSEKDKTKVEEPTQEELSKSPCGNPRWAKLPEGAESKAEGASNDEESPDPAAQDSDEPEKPDTSDDEVKDGSGDC